MLKEKAGYSKDWGLKVEDLELAQQVELQRANIQVLHLQQLVNHLENERFVVI